MRPSKADTSEPAWVKRKMLSMKRSTSCPSSSRKYSATVRPDRPTRRRAPGGSFICPYTREVLLMTPDSLISRRSEEHTSELQSRLHLVCRLLLEKKKNKYSSHISALMHN